MKMTMVNSGMKGLTLVFELHSPPQWSIGQRDGAERPTRLIAQLAPKSSY